jgi:hypothetical protein
VQLGRRALRHAQPAASSALHGLPGTRRNQTGGARTADYCRVAGRALALTGRVELSEDAPTRPLQLSRAADPIGTELATHRMLMRIERSL